MDQIADQIGNWNHSANSAAIGELICRGLICLERAHPRGSCHSNEYRLTYVSAGSASSETAATNEYRRWQEGDAGTIRRRSAPVRTSKSSPLAIETRDVLSVAIAEDQPELSVAINATDLDAMCVSSVSRIATHIKSHTSEPSATGQMRPVAPSAAELRDRVLKHVQEQGYGSQGELARAARVSPATLSRFCRGNSELSAPLRIRVAVSLAKLSSPG